MFTTTIFVAFYLDTSHKPLLIELYPASRFHDLPNCSQSSRRHLQRQKNKMSTILFRLWYYVGTWNII